MTNWKIFLLAKTESGQVGVNKPVTIGWAPYPPDANNPIVSGDSIEVTCGFGSYGYSVGTYYNLHVAAGKVSDLPSLEQQIDNNKAGSRLVNITTANTAGTNDYCVNAVPGYTNLTRNNQTQRVINSWTFNYEPGTDATSPWGLCFSFGDPHVEATGDLS